MTPAEQIIIDATCARVLPVVNDTGRLEAKPWGGEVPPELLHRLREHRGDVVRTLQGGNNNQTNIPSTPHEHEGGNKSHNGLPSPPGGPVKGENSTHSGIPSTPHSVENNPQQNARSTVDTRDSERAVTGGDSGDSRQTHASQRQNAAFVTASRKFSTTEGFSTSAANGKPAFHLELPEPPADRRDRHQREQQESAAEGDQAFWETSDRIRRERAAHGNPYAVEPGQGGACRAVLDTFADAWEVEPQDAEEALAIWEEQTHRDALTGAAKG